MRGHHQYKFVVIIRLGNARRGNGVIMLQICMKKGMLRGARRLRRLGYYKFITWPCGRYSYYKLYDRWLNKGSTSRIERGINMEDMRYEMMMDNGDAQEDIARRGAYETPADWAWQRLVREGAKCECCGSEDLQKVDHQCTYSFVSDDYEHFENEYLFEIDCMDCGKFFTLEGYYSC